MWGPTCFIGCANLKCYIKFILNRPQAKKVYSEKRKVPQLVNKTHQDPALQGIVTLTEKIFTFILSICRFYLEIQRESGMFYCFPNNCGNVVERSVSSSTEYRFESLPPPLKMFQHFQILKYEACCDLTHQTAMM